MPSFYYIKISKSENLSIYNNTYIDIIDKNSKTKLSENKIVIHTKFLIITSLILQASVI